MLLVAGVLARTVASMPGARRNLSKSAGTIIAGVLAALLIISVFLLRSAPAPESVTGSGTVPVSLSEPQLQLASVEELPVQVLPPVPDPLPSENEGGLLPDPSISSAAPSGSPSDPSTLPTPGGSSPDPADPTTGPSSAPSPGQSGGASGSTSPTTDDSTNPNPSATPSAGPTTVPPEEVPESTTTITLWLDGWSVAALGGNVLPAGYLESDAPMSVIFTPLTAQQIRAAAGSHPEEIEKYLGRLVTPKADVTCTAGNCTAGGQPVDPGVLADPASIPRLGEVYRGAGVKYGLYAARIAVTDSDSMLIVESPGTPFTLTRPAPLPGATETPGWPLSTPLSYGFGYLFPLDPKWSGSDPVRSSWSFVPRTSDPDMFLGSEFSALFMYGIADTYPSTVFPAAPYSLLSLLTSPTVACGGVALCLPDTVDPKVTSFTAREGDRCFAGASDASNRVALLQQNFTAELTLPYPILLPGVSAGSGAGSEFTSDTLEPVSGTVSFPQQSTLIADDYGLVTVFASRGSQDMSATTWEAVLPGQLGSCG